MGFFSELDIELKDGDFESVFIDLTIALLGCKKALALLTDPDASEFDADEVIDFLTKILENKK